MDHTEKICHIIGAADFASDRFEAARGDLVIACDAGILSIERIGVKPDIILGDFDSLGYIPAGDNVDVHPVRKDDTDSQLALELGLSRGFKRFILHGCTGGERFDHTVANIQTLAYAAEHGGTATLFDERFTATVIKNARLDFSSRNGGDISVFAYGGAARGVYETGLSYSASDVTLTPDRAMGASNSFIGQAASISVRDGRLLVIWSGGGRLPLPKIVLFE